jgi:hypothetical protein
MSSHNKLIDEFDEVVKTTIFDYAKPLEFYGAIHFKRKTKFLP